MTRLSNRQYPMLRAFMEVHYMSLSEAQKWDQRPFRSMLIREWVAYRPGHGFHVTRAGRDAWNEFQNTVIFRQDPNRPLTRYFDPAFYGLRPHRSPHRLQVVA
jgi:hypothetical protein